MDFGALPPEINSARIYAGPGAAPMMAAASAWNGLGAELSRTAASYQSAISALTGEEWLGPASAAMATAAAPYVAWLGATAAAAEQAAAQATSSAAAYEAAFAMTVPPPMITANRVQLVALVATNFLGVNTAAIAATEAQYAAMWAQDAAAMYGYAAASASAGVLRPLTAPTAIANPLGAAGQATTSSAGTQAGLSQLISTLPSAVQGLSSPVAAAAATPDVSALAQNLLGSTGNIVAWNMFAGISAGVGLSQAHTAVGAAAGLGGAALVNTTAPMSAVARTVTVGFGGTAPALAGMGQASSIGGMSVPTAWAATAPAPTAAAATLTGAGWTAAAEEAAPGAVMPAGMPAMASANRGGFGFGTPRYGIRPTVMSRPVAAG